MLKTETIVKETTEVKGPQGDGCILMFVTDTQKEEAWLWVQSVHFVLTKQDGKELAEKMWEWATGNRFPNPED